MQRPAGVPETREGLLERLHLLVLFELVVELLLLLLLLLLYGIGLVVVVLLLLVLRLLLLYRRDRGDFRQRKKTYRKRAMGIG